MNRIFVLMGKSASGKDSVFRELTGDKKKVIRTVVPYTTRPLREGEKDGVEYHFSSEEEFEKLKNTGKIIEDRSYNTVKGLWRYFTVDDESFDSPDDIILIGTLDTFLSIRNYFSGRKEVIPLYIECDDGERLIRAVMREKIRENPDYRELCRRFLADDEDFSEEKLRDAGVSTRIVNKDLESCVEEVRKHIWT